MVIAETPYRISFIRGGTGYPAWYMKEGGAVLSTTIDKHCCVTCRIFSAYFSVKFRIVRSYIENAGSVSEILHRMRSLVEPACSLLIKGNLDDFGRMFHENRRLKRSLGAVVSNPTIDAVYDLAMQNGALGGILPGAGSTGFVLFHVPVEKQNEAKTALGGLIHVPFKFEGQGSRIIYYTGNN